MALPAVEDAGLKLLRSRSVRAASTWWWVRVMPVMPVMF
jgi:hypothetical protein